jgi:hypothetical protein
MSEDRQKLPEQLVRQVLDRAAQLDEKERMSVSVSELRAAAVEAGISSTAVDQALSEIAREQAASEAKAVTNRAPPRTRGRWGLVAVILVLGLLMAMYGLRRSAPPTVAPVPATEAIPPIPPAPPTPPAPPPQ